MSPLDRLLEPGQLFQGALMQSLLREHFESTELPPGGRLGPFRIVRELDRGGMSIVYLASRADGEYEQEVAIKWLPSGALDAERLDQFRRERQILAQLNHPHIARLLDGGHSEDGHPWFAMERVDGLPVDRYAAAAGLGWRECVRLVLPVVEAVQFAHGRLLVHRDIKPGNVLVDNDGRAKLLDFGVAALLSDAHAHHAFTPGFASPEQLAGAPPDVASDVWQLGRLLQAVLHAPGPAAPSVPRDLAAIVARATEPESVRRYPTASALNADLQRALHYRPVTARRASPSHRLRLLAQAHPLMFIGTALMCAAFVAVIAGFMLHLARQRDLVERERAVAVAVNAFLNDDLLPGTDPLQSGSNDVSVSELIAKALDKVETRLRDVPEVAGEVDLSLGRSLSNLGRLELAQVAFERAVRRLSTSLGGQHPRVLQARLLAESSGSIDVEHLQNRERRLQALRQDMLVAGASAALIADTDNELARAAFLRDDSVLCEARYTTLLARLAELPASTQSDTYVGLSVCESRRGHFDAALEHARLAHALRARDVGDSHPTTLETGLALEAALVGLGRYSEAVEVLQDLDAKLLHRYGDRHPTTLTVAHELGFALTCAGRAVEGATWLRSAATMRARTLGHDHPWYAMSESVLAMALIREGQLSEAADALREAEAAVLAHPDINPYVRAIVLENRADLALAERDKRAAVARFDAALDAATPLYPPDHPRLAVLRLGRGLALVQSGENGEGDLWLRQSLATLGDRPDCRANQIDEARRLLSRR
jgi:serine/threonine-protein kinase